MSFYHHYVLPFLRDYDNHKTMLRHPGHCYTYNLNSYIIHADETYWIKIGFSIKVSFKIEPTDIYSNSNEEYRIDFWHGDNSIAQLKVLLDRTGSNRRLNFKMVYAMDDKLSNGD